MAQKTATLLMPAEVGRLVGAKYELVRQLGRGSMGEVWIARHRTLDERVALKLLSAAPQLGQIEDGPTAAARFQFEAQVAARLSRRTRHIVRVTDHGEEGALAYLVMELLEGYTLETTLMRRGCLTPAEVSIILVQIARGLERAHAEGVIHRDLKPANIFLARDEDGAVLAKLLDFGIARLIRGHRTTSCFSTAPNIVFGTPGYMSPEHAYPISRPDHHCDLWAAATVAYEALTGDLPVPGFSTDELLDNLRVRRFVPVLQRAPHLPKALERFFERAFAERIEDRHANAADLASAFARAAGIPNEGPRTGEERRPVPKMTLGSIVAPPRRTKVFIAAAATTVLASVVGASLALARRAAPSTTAPAPVAQQASVVDSRGSPTPNLKNTFVQADDSVGRERPADALPATTSAPKERGADVSPLITAPESASTAGPGCSPPYEFDAHGYKRWKRQCF
jgi:serine/threonine protein kinase